MRRWRLPDKERVPLDFDREQHLGVTEFVQFGLVLHGDGGKAGAIQAVL